MLVRKLNSMPWIHLFASTYCNLKCPYCSQGNNRLDSFSSDFLKDKSLIEFIESIPETSIYLSGGEPLIHEGVETFVTMAGKRGHRVSFDTNLVLPLKRLEALLSTWNAKHLGFFNISHHYKCNISLDYILERVKLLQSAAVPLFVKYVGVPEDFDAIESMMKSLQERDVGVAVTILQGAWQGRVLPSEYTLDEVIRLLNMVTLCTHGFQAFDGIDPRGLPCRGGQDFLSYNQTGSCEVIPCCHGSGNALRLQDTYFGTGVKTPRPCGISQCLGDLMFILGINGMPEEVERFDDMLRGKTSFVGLDAVLAYISSIEARGGKIINTRKLHEVRKAAEEGAGK